MLDDWTQTLKDFCFHSIYHATKKKGKTENTKICYSYYSTFFAAWERRNQWRRNTSSGVTKSVAPGGKKLNGAPPFPFFPSLPPLPLLLPSLPFPSPSIPSPPLSSLPLEVGPLNAANLVHFSLKIGHLVATILLIFLRINWPNFVQFKQ